MAFSNFKRFTVVALAIYVVQVTLPASGESGDSYARIGDRVNSQVIDGVAVTEGTIRVRRRHENDMDFSKYNPFYWEGRHAWFKVEDYTPRGEERIVFTLRTEWPQDYNKFRGSDLSAIYTGDPLGDETGRSKFAINTRMEHVADFTHFRKELGKTAFLQHPDDLTKGKLLTFEFRFFNDESHPGWVKQKARNPHNLSAYYSEFFRIKIGEPGLFIDNFQTPNALPSPSRYAGGWTTTPTVRVEPWTALQQQAFNIQPGNAQAFLEGRAWFHTDLVSGEHLSDPSDDKPSIFFEEMEAARSGFAGEAYNTRSCISCHVHDGSARLPAPGEPIHTTVLRLTDPESPHGIQLQTDGDNKEGTVTIAGYETHDVKLADGTVVELSKPIFHIDGNFVPAISPRTPPAIIGAGLLDAVPEETILELAKMSGGEPRWVGDKIGRFGWKADQPTVDSQNQGALLEDIGVKELAPEGLAKLEAYVTLLGVPPRMNPESPEVLAGEKIFLRLNCQQCHTPTLRTAEAMFVEVGNQTIHPYTDLLLHEMGPGLSDSGDHPLASKWRTAPLWALKNKRHAIDDHAERFRSGDTKVTYADTQAATAENPVQLLHDGRARSLAEAILWHGGEAEGSVAAYKMLSKADRLALEAFLWDL